MSHEGKMRRGEKWYSYRDVNGNLPDEIKNDEGKMCDVNYFLENKKKETTTSITKKEIKKK